MPVAKAPGKRELESFLSRPHTLADLPAVGSLLPYIDDRSFLFTGQHRWQITASGDRIIGEGRDDRDAGMLGLSIQNGKVTIKLFADSKQWDEIRPFDKKHLSIAQLGKRYRLYAEALVIDVWPL